MPLLYPDGSFVTLKLDQAHGGIRVSDNGFAFRELEDTCASGKGYRRRAAGRSLSQGRSMTFLTLTKALASRKLV
jgi:hypothetical protein